MDSIESKGLINSKASVFRRTITWIVLTSYIVMYGANFICNVPSDAVVNEATEQVEDHHNTDHDHSHQSHSHDKKGETSDDCCKDITNSFLNEAKLLAKQFRLELAGSYVFLNTPSYITFENLVAYTSGTIIRYVDPPPLRAVDFRIFIQSFII